MIGIDDPGTVLSTAQVSTLEAKSAVYPFDLHVFISAGNLSRGAFEARVDSAVAPGSRMVSIGVDPTHHFTHVHSSASLGLPSGPTVAQAGNAFFKAGELVEGIDAISAKANTLRQETRTVTSQTGLPIVIHEHKTADGVWWGLGCLSVLVCGIVLWAIWRTKKRDAAVQAERVALAEEASELRSRNIEEQAWADRIDKRTAPISSGRSFAASPRYYSPAPVVQAPAPVVVNNSGGSGMGLGMLLGYEMGRDNSRSAPVIVERESSGSSSSWSGDDSSSSSSYSSGSDSSSSWGSGSSDSSSSCDFGSSGGGDSGGGSDW